MPSEIGSWRRRENSGRFTGSRPRDEDADKPMFGQVADRGKDYGARSCRLFEGLDPSTLLAAGSNHTTELNKRRKLRTMMHGNICLPICRAGQAVFTSIQVASVH